MVECSAKLYSNPVLLVRLQNMPQHTPADLGGPCVCGVLLFRPLEVANEAKAGG
jgi:hypothetical protein